MNASVGVVLVTHNSERWLPETWESIAAQDHPITRLVVIDDHSTDRTRAVISELGRDSRLGDCRIDVMMSTSVSNSAMTRTAQNFAQGVVELRSFDSVVLADHDDVWRPDRITRHLQSWNPSALMVAGNGTLMGSMATLFGNFDVPSDIASWDARSLLRWVIRNSVVTGGASMVNARAMTQSPHFLPPAGWLHDRWWSILAAARAGLIVDAGPVIDYRVTAEQQVGLDRGRQVSRGISRLAAVTHADIERIRALRALKSSASPDLVDELGLPRLLRTLLN